MSVQAKSESQDYFLDRKLWDFIKSTREQTSSWYMKAKMSVFILHNNSHFINCRGYIQVIQTINTFLKNFSQRKKKKIKRKSQICWKSLNTTATLHTIIMLSFVLRENKQEKDTHLWLLQRKCLFKKHQVENIFTNLIVPKRSCKRHGRHLHLPELHSERPIQYKLLSGIVIAALLMCLCLSS